MSPAPGKTRRSRLAPIHLPQKHTDTCSLGPVGSATCKCPSLRRQFHPSLWRCAQWAYPLPLLRHRYGFLFVCLFAIMLWLTGCARSENDLENICLRRITTLAGNPVYSSRADYDRVIPTQKPESPRSAIAPNSISSRTSKIRHLATGQITHIATLPKMRWKGPVSTQRRHREH